MIEKDGTERDIIICHNQERADIRFQDGALRPVVGTKNYQVMRAGRNADFAPDGCGWTYNHAPMLAWWHERFLVQYLSDPISEHVPPSQTLLATSADGVSWSKPEVVFPPITIDSEPYRGPEKERLGKRVSCIMHQRAAFYVTRDDRLLMTAFYGISPSPQVAPNNGYGVGRVVREIYSDFSMSDIYFIRFNIAGGFTRKNTKAFPDYHDSGKPEFIAACEELLANRVYTQQWWEEERLDKEFFTSPGGQALSYYTLDNGDVIGVFKNARVILSHDRGETWEPAETDYTLETSTGKVWGQRTPDNRFILAYNPSRDSQHRWPLALVSGENGRDFSDLLSLTPEISPCKYEGIYKNLGAQYVRGICEGNPRPKGDSFWLTYSVNKEDIWVCQVPVPICYTVTTDANDTFPSSKFEDILKNWNLYSPSWAPVRISLHKATNTRCLFFSDCDPYDRARAMRSIKPASQVKLETSILIESIEDSETVNSAITIEIQDRHGSVPARILFLPDGRLRVKSGGIYVDCAHYPFKKWLLLSIDVDCKKHGYSLQVEDGEEVIYQGELAFNVSVRQVERILFTTKHSLPYQTLEDSGRDGDIGDLPVADEPTELTRFYIRNLKSKTIEI